MRPPLIFWVFNSPPRPPGADGPHRGRGHVGRHCPYTNNIWCGSVHALLRYPPKCKNSPLTPIVTKISFASFSARRGPPTPKLPRSSSWCLLYPEPKFHADRTILRWDILNCTNKQTNKQTNKTKSKLNITPNATLWRDKKISGTIFFLDTVYTIRWWLDTAVDACHGLIHLPPEVTSAPSLDTFRRRLKTYLFTVSYSNIQLS